MANVISTAGYRNVKLDLTTATATKLYSVPTNYVTVVESIMVSEDSGNADTITVTITNGSSVFTLFHVKAVGASTTVELISKDLILTAGDIVHVTAATANRLHVIMSLVQIPLA